MKPLQLPKRANLKMVCVYTKHKYIGWSTIEDNRFIPMFPTVISANHHVYTYYVLDIYEKAKIVWRRPNRIFLEMRNSDNE